MSYHPARLGDPLPSGDNPTYSPDLESDILVRPEIQFLPHYVGPWDFPPPPPPPPPSHPSHSSIPSNSLYPHFTPRRWSFAGNPSAAYAPLLPANSWNNMLPYNIDLPAPSSVRRPSEPPSYAAGSAPGHIALAAVSQPTQPHEQEYRIRSIVPHAPVPVPPSGNATPASSYPDHVFYWKHVSENAVVVDGSRVFVPQEIYQPQSQGDKDRYVSSATLQPPIVFSKQDSREWGVPVQHLLSKEPAQLLGGDEPAFTACGPSIGIRILWPGYPPYHRQVSTKDYTSKRNIISKEKLAKVVAKSVKQYMDAMSAQALAGSNPGWRVGPHHIRVDEVVLVSLHHVSQGSWQPHLRLRKHINPVFVPSQDHRAIAGPSTGMYR